MPCSTGATSPSSSYRSEEHTSELQSRPHLVCRLLLEKKKTYSVIYGVADLPQTAPWENTSHKLRNPSNASTPRTRYQTASALYYNPRRRRRAADLSVS